ncbi:MAG: SOS response-associated peptidase [Paracoccaceae bacterium]
MCGRCTLTLPSQAMAQMFAAVPGNDLPEGDNYNLCPTQTLAAVTAQDGTRRLRAMRWGFVPRWYKALNDGPLIINARSETVAEKPAFREAIRERRCIVPVSGFYEWSAGPNNTRLPWYFTRADGRPLALAGVWQAWRDLDTCAIVSTGAGPGMAGVHDREPVILEEPDWPLWLGEAGHGAARLMHASAPGVLARPWRVDPKVNSNRASGPGLIAPIEA